MGRVVSSTNVRRFGDEGKEGSDGFDPGLSSPWCRHARGYGRRFRCLCFVLLRRWCVLRPAIIFRRSARCRAESRECKRRWAGSRRKNPVYGWAASLLDPPPFSLSRVGVLAAHVVACAVRLIIPQEGSGGRVEEKEEKEQPLPKNAALLG